MQRLSATFGTLGLRVLGGLLVVGLLGWIGYREATIGSTPESWIVALDHDWASVRREARSRLVDAGEEAVGPVFEAIRDGSGARGDRAFLVLSELYASGDGRLQDHIESQLEEIEDDDSPRVRGLAQAFSLRVRDDRLRRMIERCRAMGAVVAVDAETFSGTVGPEPRRQMTVLLGPEWTGGDAGLVLLGRMPKLRVVHVLPGAPITDEQLDAFRRDRPGLRILHRGSGCIGIAGVSQPNGFVVRDVDPRSGAERAGLRDGDKIVRIDDTAITGYESLFPPLADRVPGETVTMQIERAGEPMDVTVTLGRDASDGRCECDPFDGFAASGG